MEITQHISQLQAGAEAWQAVLSTLSWLAVLLRSWLREAVQSPPTCCERLFVTLSSSGSLAVATAGAPALVEDGEGGASGSPSCERCGALRCPGSD